MKVKLEIKKRSLQRKLIIRVLCMLLVLVIAFESDNTYVLAAEARATQEGTVQETVEAADTTGTTETTETTDITGTEGTTTEGTTVVEETGDTIVENTDTNTTTTEGTKSSIEIETQTDTEEESQATADETDTSNLTEDGTSLVNVNNETTGAVAINETNFPDDAFRKYIADTFDLNFDNVLSEYEISITTRIYSTNLGIESIQGVEYFVNLKTLWIYGNKLKSVDISHNNKISSFMCDSNDISELDLSKNTELVLLSMNRNNLTNLDLSNNLKLVYLTCSNNALTQINISNLTNLKELDCGYNKLTEVDVSKNDKLESLTINGNGISAINLKNNINLTIFACAYTNITSLDLSNNNYMNKIVCAYTKVGSIVWGNMSNYISMNVTNSLVGNIDISQCPELSVLYCSNNNMTQLDITKNTKLKILECDGNNLTELDTRNNTILNYLDCSNNHITKLELPNHKQLYDLYCDSNNLVSLDLSNTDVRRGNYQANKRELSADKDGYVDLSVLESDGFDISKASNWSNNVVVDTATKKIKVDFSASTTRPKQVEVTYRYNTNNTYLAADQEFILVITQYRTNIADAVIEMDNAEFYWGMELDGIRKITYNGEELINGGEYRIDGGGTNINVGTATITIIGINDFTGSVTKTFQILPAEITSATLANIGDQTFTGSTITPDVSLKLNHLPNYLVKDKDYTLNYANNTSVGIATVTITGKGNYTGDYTSNFKINPSNIAAGKIEDIPNQTYTGSEVKPGIKITANNTSLVSGTDYDLSYSNNVNLGTATVTATGKGNYTGSISKTYKIAIATVSNLRNSKSTTSYIKLKWDKASGVSGYEIYSCKTGSKKFTKLTTIKKASTTTYTNKKLKIGTAYSYKIRAYKTINGKKQYGEYTEVLNTTTSMAKPVVKLSAGSKKVTITYQKVSGANGYEIYMSTSKKGTYENIKTLTKASKIKYTKTGLKKKKTYYFKVRAYKIVNGEKVYSSYSTVKKVKVK